MEHCHRQFTRRGMSPGLFYNGLDKLLTVLPVSKKGLRGSGKKRDDHDFDRININAASVEMLARLPGMTPELAEAVQSFRKENGSLSRSQLSKILGSDVYKKVSRYISLDSLSYYTISSVGRLNGSQTRKGVEAMILLDPDAEKRYRIISWHDGIRESTGALLLSGAIK